jgi:adenylosuccinate lyase
MGGGDLHYWMFSQFQTTMENIPNILATRYASDSMKAVWSAEGRITLEREYWIAVLRAQKDLGLDIPQEAIDAY